MHALPYPLRLVTGLPGAGKSAVCLAEFLQHPSQTTIVVPGHAQAEALKSRIPEEDQASEIAEGQIVTWDFFCKQLASQNRKSILPTASRALRVGAIGRCAEVVLAEDGYFGKVRTMPGFHRRLVDILEELSQAGFTSDSLLEIAFQASERASDRRFIERIQELCSLWEEYQHCLGKLRVSAPTDTAWSAIDAVEQGAHIDFQSVWFDGFQPLNEAQFAIMETLSKRGASVGVTLAWHPERTRLFTASDRARTHLLKRFDVEETQLPSVNQRAKSRSLQLLSHHLFHSNCTDTEPAQPQIIEIDAPNRYGEIEQIAREAYRLQKCGAYKFEEMAFVARDWNGYAPIVSTVLPRFGIKFTWERDEPLLRNPLARTILRTLELFDSNWRRGQVIEILASSYSPLNRGKAQRIARASAKARVKDGREEWASFAALCIQEEDSQEAGEFLQMLIDWQERVSSKPQTASDYNKLIEEMIDDLGYEKSNPSIDISLQKTDRQATRAAFDALTTLADLDRLSSNEPQPYGSYLERLKTCWDEATFRLPTDDKGVRLLEAANAGGFEPKIAFVVGLLEGSFPRRINEEPFLRDDERQLLAELTGKQLTTGQERAEEERLRFYLAVTLPSEKLYVTYPRTGDDSDAIPAFYLNELRDALPPGSVKTKEYKLSQVAPLREEATTLADRVLSLAAEYGAGVLSETPGVPLLEERPTITQDLIEWRRLPRSPETLGDDAAKLRAWNGRTLPVTELESLARCPLQHLARFCMQLHALHQGIQRTDQGQLVHVALRRRFSKKPNCEDSETLAAELRREIDELLEENPPDGSAWELRMLRLLADELLSGFAIREALYQSAFGLQPNMFELAFGMIAAPEEPDMPSDRPLDPNSKPQPLSIPLPTGETLNICGTMDRVDVNEDGNLAMVIDYKLEGQQRWIEVDNGGSLQMPLYAMALKELFGIANIIPAYDSLSRGARDRLLSLEIPAPQRAQFARPLAGEDSRSIKTMGIPQFNQWLLFTKKTVARLAMQLKQAQITPRPGDHCNHCSYGDLCRVDRFGRHDGEPLNATPFD